MLRVLKQRNLSPFFVGNLVSNTGTWFQNIAQSLLIFRLTGSTFLVGVVNFAQFVGVVGLAPWAGSAADQYDRKRLLLVTQGSAVVITVLFAVLNSQGLAPVGVVIGLALLLGLTTAFATPAMLALIPLLVSQEDLGPAVGLSSLSFNVARAVGPVAGAFVVARYGITAAFALNSLSYAIFIVGLLIVHPRAQAARAALRPKLRESFKLVRGDAMLAALLATVAVISIAQDPVNTLTPGFAADLFHRPDSYTGFLVGAFGVGAVVSAVAFSGRKARNPTGYLSFTCLLLGAGIIGFAVSPSLPYAYAALFVGGAGFLLTNTAATTAVQLQVDDRHRGRVMALWSLAFLGTRPFGSLADGALADRIGLRPGAAVMGSTAVLAAVLLLFMSSRRRRASVAVAVNPASGAERLEFDLNDRPDS